MQAEFYNNPELVVEEDGCNTRRRWRIWLSDLHSSPTNIVITRCAHIWCQSYILKTLRRGRRCCPLCRHDLSESDIFSAPTEKSNAEIIQDNCSPETSIRSTGSGPHSKVCCLLTVQEDADVTWRASEDCWLQRIAFGWINERKKEGSSHQRFLCASSSRSHGFACQSKGIMYGSWSRGC